MTQPDAQTHPPYYALPHWRDDMTKTYTVAVHSGTQILYATDGTGEGWTDILGLAAGLTAAARDGAVTAAIAAGMPYDILERDALPPYTRTRIGGTLALLAL